MNYINRNLKPVFLVYILIICTLNGNTQDYWTKKTGIPNNRHTAISFVIGDYAYVGLGSTDYEGRYLRDMYKYDPINDKWTKLNDFPGEGLYKATAFSIQGKGYICLGNSDLQVCQNELWEYRPESDSYFQMASFPGTPRYGSFSFVLNDKAYIGGGSYGNGYDYLADFWCYDPQTNEWIRVSDFPGGPILDAVSFVYESNAFVGCGGYNTLTPRQDFWKYFPETDTWSQIESYPDLDHTSGTSFIFNDKGYVGTGINVYNNTYHSSFFYYNFATGNWNGPVSPPSTCKGRHNPIGFSVDQIAYFGTGITEDSTINDLWSLSDCSPPISFFNYQSSDLLVTFTNLSHYGESWLWDFGDGYSSVMQSPSHSYQDKSKYLVCLTAQNSCGITKHCDTVDLSCPAPIARFLHYITDSVVFFVNTSSEGSEYLWDFGDSCFSSFPNPDHVYTLYGRYLVCLSVRDSCSISTYCDSVVFCETPETRFGYKLKDNIVELSDSSLHADNYIWSFGDGIISNERNPTHKYNHIGKYQICLKTSNICDSSTACKMLDILKLSEESEVSSPWIYPNPTTGRLNICIPEDVTPANICVITDLLGKKLCSIPLIPTQSHHKITIENLADGVYFVSIMNNSFSLHGAKIILCKE